MTVDILTEDLPYITGNLLDHDEERRLIALIQIGDKYEKAPEEALADYAALCGRVPPKTAYARSVFVQRLLSDASDALSRMVECNIGLVLRALRDMGSSLYMSFLTKADLIQEGRIGIITAARRFDLTRNTAFSTYATYWIKQSIGRAIENAGHGFRVPVHIQERRRICYNVAADYEARLGRLPSPEEVSLETGLSERQIAQVEQTFTMWSQVTGDLNWQSSGEDEYTSYLMRVPDAGTDTEETATKNADLDLIRKHMDKLNEREQMVITLHYGLALEEMNFSEIGLRMGISRERVRQLHNDAVRKLQHAMGVIETVELAA